MGLTPYELARAEVIIAVTLQLVASRSGASPRCPSPAKLLASRNELQLSFAHLYGHEHTHPSEAHAACTSTESHLQHEVNRMYLWHVWKLD